MVLFVFFVCVFIGAITTIAWLTEKDIVALRVAIPCYVGLFWCLAALPGIWYQPKPDVTEHIVKVDKNIPYIVKEGGAVNIDRYFYGNCLAGDIVYEKTYPGYWYYGMYFDSTTEWARELGDLVNNPESLP